MRIFSTLYHGSGSDFEQIDLSFGVGEGLEFGAGFYTTNIQSVAIDYAFLSILGSEQSVAYVHSFEFDYDLAINDLNVITFNGYTPEWFEYVNKNIHGNEYTTDCDIVIGPLENEDAWKIFRKHGTGELSESELIDRLKDIDFDIQITFKTERSLSYLNDHSIITLRKEERNA